MVQKVESTLNEKEKSPAKRQYLTVLKESTGRESMALRLEKGNAGSLRLAL